MARIVEVIVIVEEGAQNQTIPTVQVTERSWLLDPNTFDTIEIQPSPDSDDNAFHQQQGGIVIDEIEICSLEGGPVSHSYSSHCWPLAPSPIIASNASASPARGASPSSTRSLFGKSKDSGQGEEGERTGTSGILFPGYNYLGPGNRGYNGPPTNEIDAAAKRHDEEYTEILKRLKETGDEDEAYRAIQEADERFLKAVANAKSESYLERGGQLAGTLGIGTKKLVENVLGFSLYPLIKQPRIEVNIKNKLELPEVKLVNVEVPFIG